MVSPIQQALVDGEPDVDAVFRLTHRLPPDFRFDAVGSVALSEGTWCPFNSQNTFWAREAFPLLYLPIHCSFRSTDIFRSLVAQRVAWQFGWKISFHPADMEQVRNPHDLMADFCSEIPVYRDIQAIRTALEKTVIDPSTSDPSQGLRACYASLVQTGIFPREELALLDAWLSDLKRVRSSSE